MTRHRFFAIRWTFIPVAILFLSSCQRGCQTLLTWEYGRVHEVRYSGTLERGLLGGAPEMTETLDLGLRFVGNKRVEIDFNGIPRGSFFVSAAGELELGDTLQVPPYISTLLLSLIPANDVRGTVGSTWETVFPSAAQIQKDVQKVSMQDRYTTRFDNETGTSVGVSVKGDVRIVNNPFTAALLADTMNAFARVFDWNLFLSGTATYDKNAKAIDEFEAYYLLMPSVNATEDSIKQSRHRQHLVLKRIP